MTGKATAGIDERGGTADEPSAAPSRGASTNGETGRESAPSPAAPRAEHRSDGSATEPSFVRRHRLPLALAVIALCLYVGSIVYILFGRGQIA